MNPNVKPGRSGRFLARVLASDGAEARFRAIVTAAAYALCVASAAVFGGLGRGADLRGIEAGRVAERDVVAESELSYVDEEATALRREAEKRLVPAVIVVDEAASKAAVADYARFRSKVSEIIASGASRETVLRRLAVEFPGASERGLFNRLVDYPVPATPLAHAGTILEAVLARGVAALPAGGLERFNPEIVELRRLSSGPLTYEQLPLERLVTLRNADRAALEAAQALRIANGLSALSQDLAKIFIRENAYFDAALSERRQADAAAAVQPVTRRIERGERVIRKGFIIDQNDVQKLYALRRSGVGLDMATVIGSAALLAFLFAGTYLLLRREGFARAVHKASFILAISLAAAYFVAASALAGALTADATRLIAAFMPTALFAILTAILFNEGFAVIYSLALAFSLLIAGGLDGASFILALSSGIGGVLMVRKAEKRIDLIRAGSLLAALQLAAGLAVGSFVRLALRDALVLAALSALNGFFCSVLALGFLPVLEQALNAATLFRLQELSDLNAPALKRLLSVAPGTYSHSITVAHLAESACREIGADALLARVGAYYHDIGKTEQPEYFIENQSGYNKHDDINPRLSATVLRSHVKFGLERADSLRLPQAVRDIIAEHHGSSVMAYFYAQAQKEDGETAKADDFCYPGPEPSSREAAVVMLADGVEAASRTLKRPSMAKLEQFVREMVMEKFAQGQLARSSLSFHDLETIINTFVRILAGHFHSRIEYPKLKEGSR